MEEKALLVEIEKEQEKVIEKKIAEQRKHYHDEVVEKQKSPEDLHLFSSKTYPQTLPKFKTKQEVKNEQASTKVIEKPNYDLIEELSPEEREKVFVIEKEEVQEQTKKKPSLFKKVAFSLLFGIFGIWSIVNLTQIDVVSNQISEISKEYNMNLISYLNNLRNLDATNSENMQNLLETIPDHEIKPSGMDKQSNWFDRFCNFMGGLFGG